MEHHGINMKGKYFMETVSAPTSGSSSNARRLVYNTGTSINGSTDSFGQFKMYFHGQGGKNQWMRPLLANFDDGPDQDNKRQLGSSSVRFKAIYSADFYGQVRYS